MEDIGGKIEAFWRRYCRQAGLGDDLPFQAWAFGDSPEMADELAALVIDGPKRATAGLVADYEADGDPLPVAGDHSVILDGGGRPVAVIRATEVRVLPFAEVDEAFAYDEGEGDRTLAWWREAHWQFFSRQCAMRGEVMDERQPVVLERFELVYAARQAGGEGESKAMTTTQPILQGATGEWEMVIGLEVHAQVISKAKLFSGAATDFGAAPNEQVSLVDAAMPGMLPVINEVCVEQAVRTGLGLMAEINKHSVFDRKNYFYADLPQGYQISQYLQPIVGKGEIILDLPGGEMRTVGITRLHLEQDAGKSLHDQHPSKTFVDLNRSGVALMEIVSEPDLRGPEEAAAYLRKLRSILRYLGTCDGNMEEGSMRCDVNVSVRRVGDNNFGTRCEVKNVNSIRAVQQAIDYEAARQVELLEDGGAVIQETRLWDPGKGQTRSMRGKEEAHDYRYFPDPDLLPLEFDDAFIERIRETLPELPDEKKLRFINHYGLPPYDAGVLVAERARADFYEAVVKGDGKRDPKIAANWLITELLGALNKGGHDIVDSPISADQLGGLIDLIGDDTISGRIAKEVFAEMLETGEDAGAIVEKKGLKQITDSGAIESIVDEVIAGAATQVEQFKSGNEKVLGWFVGQVMKATQGKANPGAVNKILREKLK